MSVFDDYIKSSPNSFDANLEEYDHDEPLFPYPVLLNSKYQSILNNSFVFGSKLGFYLKNDCIICNIPDSLSERSDGLTTKLKLIGCNRYYYTYKSASKNGEYYLIYSKLGFEKLRRYVYEASSLVGDEVYDESVVGAMTIFCRYFSGKKDDACISLFMTKKCFLVERAWNIEEIGQETLTIDALKNPLTRGFSMALTHDLMKQTGYTISPEKKVDFSQLGGWKSWCENWCEKNPSMDYGDVYKTEKSRIRKLYEHVFYEIRTVKDQSVRFLQFIKENYNTFSDDLKDECKYLLPEDYKHTPMSKVVYQRFRDDKMIAFTNIMMQIYKRGVTDRMAILSSTKESDELHKLFDSLINDVFLIKDKLSWLDDDGIVSMEYISGLLLANSDINPVNFQHRIAVAVWAFYMLYKKTIDSSFRDKQLFNILICHVIGTNSDVFEGLVNKIKVDSLWSKYDSDYCVGEMISYYSDSFTFKENQLSTIHQRYLGYRCNADSDYFIKYREKVTSTTMHSRIQQRELADLLFDYVSEILHRPDYTNKCIIDAVYG